MGEVRNFDIERKIMRGTKGNVAEIEVCDWHGKLGYVGKDYILLYLSSEIPARLHGPAEA